MGKWDKYVTDESNPEKAGGESKWDKYSVTEQESLKKKEQAIPTEPSVLPGPSSTFLKALTGLPMLGKLAQEKLQSQSGSSTLPSEPLKSASPEIVKAEVKSDIPTGYQVTVSDSGPQLNTMTEGIANSKETQYEDLKGKKFFIEESRKSLLDNSKKFVDDYVSVSTDIQNEAKGIEDIKSKMQYYGDFDESGQFVFKPGMENNPFAQQLAGGQLPELGEKVKQLNAKIENAKPVIDKFNEVQSQVESFENYAKTIEDKFKALEPEVKTSYVEGAAKALQGGMTDLYKSIAGGMDLVGDITGNRILNLGAYNLDQFADEAKKTAEFEYKDTPETTLGYITSGIAGMAPDLLVTALLPEMKILRLSKATGGTIKSISSFGVEMGLKEAGRTYGETGDITETLKEGAKGFTEGSIMHGLGYTGSSLGKLAEKKGLNSLISSTASAAGTGGLFTGYEYLLGERDPKKLAASFGMGVAFGAKEIGKALYEQANVNFFTSTPAEVAMVYDMKITPVQMREKAAELIDKASGEGDVKTKRSYLVAAETLMNYADIKARTQQAINDPAKEIEAVIKDPALSPEEKAYYTDFIQKVSAENNPLVKEAKPFTDKIKKIKNKIKVIEENPYLPEADKKGQVSAKEAEIKEYQSKVDNIYSLKTTENGKEKSKEGSQEKGVSEEQNVLIEKNTPSDSNELDGVFETIDKAGQSYYWQREGGKVTSLTETRYEELKNLQDEKIKKEYGVDNQVENQQPGVEGEAKVEQRNDVLLGEGGKAPEEIASVVQTGKREYIINGEEKYIVPTSNADIPGNISIDKATYDKWKLLDEEEAMIKDAADRMYRNDQDGNLRHIKSQVMRIAAEKRSILGTNTGREIADVKGREDKIQVGDKANIGGVDYEVTGSPFGRIKVKTNEGKEFSVDRDSSIAKELQRQKPKSNIVPKGEIIENLDEYLSKQTKPKTEQYALQKPKSESVFSREQGEAGKTGGEPQGVGPEQQGVEAPEASAKEEEARIAEEVASYTPEEIEQAYKERDAELASMSKADYKMQYIHDNLQRIRKEDFFHYASKGDYKGRESALNIKHMSKDARPLDEIAQGMSETAGVEITPQDIVGYIIERDKFPEKYKQTKARKIKQAALIGDSASELRDKYSEYDLSTPEAIEKLRGFPLSDADANTLIASLKYEKSPAKSDVVRMTLKGGKEAFEARELQAVDKQASRDSGKDWEQAKKDVDSGKSEIDIIGDEILAGKRQATAQQKLEMGYRLSKAIDAYDQAIIDLKKAREEMGNIATAEDYVALKEAEMRKWQEINNISQSEWGRFGRYSQALITKTKSLEWAKQRLDSAEKFDKNSKEAVAAREKVEEVYKEIDALKEKLSTVEKGLEEATSQIEEMRKGRFEETEASKKLRAKGYKAEYEGRKENRTERKKRLDEERKSIFENIKRIAKEGPSGPHDTNVARQGAGNIFSDEMIKELVKLVDNYAKRGITDIAQVVDDIFLNLKESMPGLTHQDVYDNVIGGPLKMDVELPKYKERLIEEKIARIEKSLERSIDELQKQLASGKFKTPKEKAPVTKEIAELKKEKERLQKQVKIAKDVKYEIEKAYDKVEGVIEERVEENRTTAEKLRSKAANVVFGIMRPLSTGLDLSAAGIQAAMMSAGNPKNIPAATKRMFNNMFSEKKADRYMYDIKSSPYYKYIKEAGLFLADAKHKEEGYEHNLIEKIPWLGDLVKGGQRGYNAYINSMRMYVYSSRVNKLLSEKNKDGTVKSLDKNLDEFKAEAKAVNSMSGRGSLGTYGEKIATPANTIFFSVRNMAAQAQVLGLSDIGYGMFGKKGFYRNLTPSARKLVAKNLSMYVGTGVATLFLLDTRDDMDVDWNPWSSHFLQVKHGDTWISIFGAYATMVKKFIQMVSMHKMNNETGEFDFANPLETAGSFFRAKESPEVSLVHDWAAGRTKETDEKGDYTSTKNFIGQQQSLGDAILHRIAPMSAASLYDVYKEKGAAGAAGYLPIAALGYGLQTYNKEKEADKKFDERMNAKRDIEIATMDMDNSEEGNKKYDAYRKANAELFKKAGYKTDEELAEIQKKADEREAKEEAWWSAHPMPEKK